jgi:hypothetical protein
MSRLVPGKLGVTLEGRRVVAVHVADKFIVGSSLACPFGHIGSVSVTKKTEGTEALAFI